MRGNRVKQKLQSGEIATVVSGHSISSATIDFCGPLGFDGFWIEGEHGSAAWHQIGDLSRACDLWEIASVMRVHSHDAGLIGRTLDLGVNGIVAPHVNSRSQAEQIVAAARFAPEGKRGIFSGRRSFGEVDYLERANEEVLVVVLIEEHQAIERLDEILAVDHIDVFFVAPGDLAQTMGFLGQPYHPEVQAVVQDALTRITAAGRVAGSLAHSATLARDVELGARFFLTSFDPWLRAGAQEFLSHVATVGAHP
ncbi:MAG: hypothetical protein HC802_21905 [Caldilineaceae bacterium]|nr:hypothetical protein [Caldilineaceae bacterium]